MRAGVKPAGQTFAARKRTALRARSAKTVCATSFAEVLVAVDLPERGGIDEIDMAFHQFGEGVSEFVRANWRSNSESGVMFKL